MKVNELFNPKKKSLSTGLFFYGHKKKRFDKAIIQENQKKSVTFAS
jgi:hypothetical protein